MQLLFYILFTFAIYTLIAVSFSLIYDITKYLHFSHAVTISLSPYLFYFYNARLNNTFFSIVLSLFAILIIAYLIEKVYFIIGKNEEKTWPILITSLGFYVIITNILSLFSKDRIILIDFFPTRSYHINSIIITNKQLIIIFFSLLIPLIIYIFQNYTSTGKKMKAVASNVTLSNILGIHSRKISIISFLLGSLIAGIAGLLLAIDIPFSTTTGFWFFLYAVIAMIIGGMGKMRYLIMGALLLASTQHLSAYYLDSKWMNATAFIILIVFLYFKPYGFSGKKLKKTVV